MVVLSSLLSKWKNLSVAKDLDSWLAYNYSNVKDYITAGSIAFSSWRDNRTVNGNNKPELAQSDYEVRNRIIGNVNWRKEMFKHAALQLSLFGTVSVPVKGFIHYIR